MKKNLKKIISNGEFFAAHCELSRDKDGVCLNLCPQHLANGNSLFRPMMLHDGLTTLTAV